MKTLQTLVLIKFVKEHQSWSNLTRVKRLSSTCLCSSSSSGCLYSFAAHLLLRRSPVRVLTPPLRMRTWEVGRFRFIHTVSPPHTVSRMTVRFSPLGSLAHIIKRSRLTLFFFLATGSNCLLYECAACVVYYYCYCFYFIWYSLSMLLLVRIVLFCIYLAVLAPWP